MSAARGAAAGSRAKSQSAKPAGQATTTTHTPFYFFHDFFHAAPFGAPPRSMFSRRDPDSNSSPSSPPSTNADAAPFTEEGAWLSPGKQQSASVAAFSVSVASFTTATDGVCGAAQASGRLGAASDSSTPPALQSTTVTPTKKIRYTSLATRRLRDPPPLSSWSSSS